jgi:hypothetical protein
MGRGANGSTGTPFLSPNRRGDVESPEQRHLIDQLVDAVPSVLEVQMLEGSRGACLGTSALLAVVFREHGIYTEAVHGTFDGHAHWWLESSTLLLDATRDQFDDGATVSDKTDASPHEALERWPAAWTEEQAVLEFARMYGIADIGAATGRTVLAELRELADTAAI